MNNFIRMIYIANDMHQSNEWRFIRRTSRVEECEHPEFIEVHKSWTFSRFIVHISFSLIP